MRRVLALLAVLALVACGKGAEQQDVLRVGSQKGGLKAVMIASGALKDAPYRVEWSEFPAAQNLLEALGAGAVDLGWVGDAPFAFAYQSGSPVRAVAAQTIKDWPRETLAVIVPRGSPARSLADLKGKRIAATRGSTGHRLILRALARSGMSPGSVNLIFLSPADAHAAFQAHAIDAWAIWIPYLKSALNDDARVLVDSKGLVQDYSFDVASDQALSGKRALIDDFARRETKALEWAISNKTAYASVVARDTGLPRDIAVDYAMKNSRVTVPIDDHVLADQQAIVADFAAAGMLVQKRPVAEAFRHSP